MARGEASKDEIKAVEKEITRLKAEKQLATVEHEKACAAQRNLESKLELMEAGFAQDELLMFIDKRFIHGRYARDPYNLADAMAGLPYTQALHFMGVWQSYVRCSQLPCAPHHRFQVFETIQSIWKKSRKSKVPAIKFFEQEIASLPERVKVIDPVTKKETSDTTRNEVRSYLLDFWPIWELAIEKSLATEVDPERVPFLICANFAIVQQDPKTSVRLVLGAKTDNTGK